MGLATILLAISGAATVVQTVAGVEQAKAEQEDLYQQEIELNKIAASEAAEAARRADKKAAEAIAGMEAIGGYGSYNDHRLQLEIAGLKGLDLARIESNRSRQAAQLYAARRSVANAAVGQFFGGLGQFAGSVAGYYGTKKLLGVQKAQHDIELRRVQHLDSGG
jgi:hypothetical protein